MAYGVKTGTEPQRNKPWWWKAMEDVAHIAGLGYFGENIKPEALFARSPRPSFRPPSPTLRRAQGSAATGSTNTTTPRARGRPAKAAQMRAGNKWLDTDLSYYDASPEEQLAMKRDPANAEHLKFWVSPYNYSKDGMPYNGYEWQMQFTLGVVSRKEED